MITILKTSRLAAAVILFVGATVSQAQTNTGESPSNQPPNVVTVTNIVTVTNVVTVTNIVTVTNGAGMTNRAIATNNAALTRAKVTTPTNGWQSSIAFGLTLARGNTDTTLASATVTTQKKWLNNDLKFGAEGLYGEAKLPNEPTASATAETLHGYSQYNRILGHDFYFYGRVDGFHDGIADIKYRLTLAPGIGYYFITNKTVDLNLEMGPGYIKEQLDGESESFATLRIAEKCHYAISPHAKAWEMVEFLPQVNEFNNYIINSELGVEASLTKGNRFSVRTVLQDSYNNVPAADRLKNDLKLITSLAYKF